MMEDTTKVSQKKNMDPQNGGLVDELDEAF